MSWLIFERSLILEVDENKDGVFDFQEVVKFMVDTHRVKDRSEGEQYATWFFSMFREECE